MTIGYLEGLFQKSARKDGFKFLNIADVQWKPELLKLVAQGKHLLPAVFAEDPFAQLALLLGNVVEIDVDSGSEKQVFIESPTQSDGFTNALYLVTVAENSNLELVFFQTDRRARISNVESNEQNFSRIHFNLGKKSVVKATIIQSGNRKSQVRIHAECLGEGSEIMFHGLTVGKHSERQDLWVDVVHSVPHTRSDLVAWCVVQDQAHSVFNATMSIAQSAPFTETFQKNKNLILSERATVDTFPKLFIENSEVKCAHGSSVSTLEPEQLLYLQTRGINRDQAEQMLLNGFIRQAIDWIKNSDTKKRVASELLDEDEEDYSDRVGSS